CSDTLTDGPHATLGASKRQAHFACHPRRDAEAWAPFFALRFSRVFLSVARVILAYNPMLERNQRFMQKRLFGALALALIVISYTALGRESVPSEYAQDVKVTPLLQTTTTTLGQLIEYPKTDRPEVTALEVEIPPGKETGWHKHPVPGYAYVLAGTLTIEMEDGKHFQFEAGKAFVEVINTLHNGKNLGTEPVRLIAFFSGEAGKPFTIRP